MKQASWEECEDFAECVAAICRTRKFSGVYGVPRGGLVLAVMVSHVAGLPMLMAPCADCLIVDDIADTGETLAKYAGREYIATLYYRRGCSYVPNFWLKEKVDGEWIVFPWEEKCSS